MSQAENPASQDSIFRPEKIKITSKNLRVGGKLTCELAENHLRSWCDFYYASACFYAMMLLENSMLLSYRLTVKSLNFYRIPIEEQT